MNRAHTLTALIRSLFVLLALLVGCAPEAKQPKAAPEKPADPITIRLGVVDDAPLAKAIGALAAEWQARSGNTLLVEDLAAPPADKEWTFNHPLDAMIYADRMLGALVAAKQLAPLPAEFAQSHSLAWPDVFEQLQLVETRWGAAVYGVPFGSPVLVCCCRTDLLESLHRRPPETWTEYHELAELLYDRKSESGARLLAAEPLASGWAGRSFLARAAAYARHRDHYSALFNIETLEPLIAGPPFVRALEELVADAKLGPADAQEMDPWAVRKQFMSGKLAMAICWPNHGGASEAASELPISCLEVPGSRKVYNFAGKTWDDRPADNRRVTTLGLAGRLGSITAQATHSLEVFQLLSWLSGQEWGSKVSAASDATTLYRRSQIRAPGPWLESGLPERAVQQYALTVRDALSRDSHLMALRIPGEQQYMDALDVAVRRAVKGDATPADALTQVANEWQKINQQLGIESQRQAYRQSLGLD